MCLSRVLLPCNLLIAPYYNIKMSYNIFVLKPFIDLDIDKGSISLPKKKTNINQSDYILNLDTWRACSCVYFLVNRYRMCVLILLLMM